MKRWFWMLPVLALLGMLCAPALGEEMRTTVLVYISGADLESEDASATADIQEMVRAGVQASGPVTVLVEAGGAKRWHTDGLTDRNVNLLQVTQDGIAQLDSPGKCSMGDADTLAGFLAYARENAPADRTLLVLWGHGDGPTSGVCFDELYEDDALMLDEIAAALREADAAGQNTEAVIFDACLMNCADLLTNLGQYTDLIVASQESTLGTGARYDLWLAALAADPDIDTRALCEIIAETYIGTASHGLFSQVASMSVLDAAQSDALTAAVEALYARLDALSDDDLAALPGALENLASFGEFDGSPPSGLMDAAQLCDVLEAYAPQECAALRAAVADAVCYKADSGKLAGQTCGLSLFLPCTEQDWPDALYDWYRPLTEERSYAHLIVRLAAQLDTRQSASLIDLLRGAFIGSGDTGGGPAVDRQHIWQGLDAPAAVSQSTSAFADATPSDPSAPAVDRQHIWQGLAANE